MAGYTVALREKFSASHFFNEKKETAEGLAHPHHYYVEIRVEGKELDGSGYLIDLEEIDLFMKDILSHYSDILLNDLPEFANLPPSLEHFARILCQTAFHRLISPHIKAICVKLWESERAWASFREERK